MTAWNDGGSLDRLAAPFRQWLETDIQQSKVHLMTVKPTKPKSHSDAKPTPVDRPPKPIPLAVAAWHCPTCGGRFTEARCPTDGTKLHE